MLTKPSSLFRIHCTASANSPDVGLLRGEWKLRRSSEADPRPPFLVLPMFHFVAEFSAKLIQGVLDIPVDFNSGMTFARQLM